MTLAIFLIAAMFAIGVPKRSAVHPEAAAILLDEPSTALDCRPAAGPDSVLEEEKPSRTANFRVMGQYECRRPVFTPEERDPYNDRALEAADTNAKLVAQKLKLHDAKEVVRIRIEGDLDETLRSRLATIYRSELEAVLGPGRIALDSTDPGPTLVVELLRVDAPDVVARVRLARPDKKGGQTWQSI